MITLFSLLELVLTYSPGTQIAGFTHVGFENELLLKEIGMQKMLSTG